MSSRFAQASERKPVITVVEHTGVEPQPARCGSVETPRHRRDVVANKGSEIGEALADRAAVVLLREYSNRPWTSADSPAVQQWGRAWASLIKALGARAHDAKVASALTALDNAFSDSLAEHEDLAWHAAWAAAMSLK